ncbi:efflux RND transporter periplasmic adaptor subunit [Enterocloster lavalensis]|uniref:HlyD family secretion protein n=1 Tax=Enterocloster lavalensis TaxID=460384 RepID=A0A1I0AQX2_9FIRM|nr:efflux RND transporter periplasmic adaptor subunit [Enterocloster lavalensis]PST33418.1 efflux RND transporter periplasmic adaptor subunit [Enterocloster lavalensis]SES95866.1 HlyD family secretion protein [Enterocloster lavalensis]
MDGKFKFKFRKKGGETPSGSGQGEASRTPSGKGRQRGRKGGKGVKIIVALLLVAAALIGFMAYRNSKAKQAAATAKTQNTASVERRNITSELSSSGTLAAKDTYSITSLVEGEVLSANFEEGDQVEKDQVLYEIDKSSMETQLTSANNSLERANSSYEDATEDYQDALNDYSGNTYKATEAGYIKELYVNPGDKVSGNTKLADIYSDDVMELRIPFLSGEAAAIGVGNGVTVTLTDTGEQIGGTVKAVANQERVLTGGRLVRYVTISVPNPGGLTDTMRATAQIGDFSGSEDGTFEASVDTTMNADLSTGVEVEAVLVNEGDYVSKGTPMFRMTSKSADKLIQSYKDALDKAQESLESAQSKLESTQDSYDNYTITAPISGQVIAKNFKVGDNITKNTSNTTVLATIYDLSSLTFEMSIDELDIRKVKVGQKVAVTADAFEGQSFSGTVTNVSLESTYSNGVSTYPVTVTLDETGDLLPGMNVDGVITLEEANDVLAIPVDALMRGNRVYVKDETVTEQQGPVPAGFRSVEVETGLTNDSYVEIKSGLSEGDVVYVAESTASNVNSFMMMPAGGGGMGGPPEGGQGGGNRQGGGGMR